MKSLTRSFAAAAIAIIVASHASANPIDTDNDEVFDDDDACPTQPGYGWNDGCPGVRVTGTRNNFWLVECPDGSTVSVWTQCRGFENWTRWHASYYDQDTGELLYTDTHTTETETTEEPDEEESGVEGEDFAEVDCDAGITACWTPGDWFAFCTTHGSDNPGVQMAPECDFLTGSSGALSAIEARLMEIARDYPRTTCAVGVAASAGAAVVFAKIKNKDTAGVTWVIVSTTAVGCAFAMDIVL